MSRVRAAVTAVLDRVRKVRLKVRFYNLRVGRSNAQVSREIYALLADRPALLGMCEAVGYVLYPVPGYRLLRDNSNRSRANVAAYVRDDLAARLVRWHDLTETWDRTEHDGRHEARSFIEFFIGRTQVLVGHQAPKGTNNTHAAQTEGVELVVRRMAPWRNPQWAEGRSRMVRRRARRRARRRPRLLIWDANRTAREDGPGPAVVAAQIGGHVVTPGIDSAVKSGAVEASDVEHPHVIAGVILLSDHKTALEFVITVAARWLTAPRLKGVKR